jgi:hypothetical protein
VLQAASTIAMIEMARMDRIRRVIAGLCPGRWRRSVGRLGDMVEAPPGVAIGHVSHVRTGQRGVNPSTELKAN